MSLKTWQEEFYPTSAAQLMTEREAIEHSLRKWRGLTEENLVKHQVKKDARWIEGEDASLEINADTCALCHNFQIIDEKTAFQYCHKCPIEIVKGVRCDRGSFSPYGMFLWNDDPRPMIKLLEEVLHAS